MLVKKLNYRVVCPQLEDTFKIVFFKTLSVVIKVIKTTFFPALVKNYVPTSSPLKSKEFATPAQNEDLQNLPGCCRKCNESTHYSTSY